MAFFACDRYSLPWKLPYSWKLHMVVEFYGSLVSYQLRRLHKESFYLSSFWWCIKTLIAFFSTIAFHTGGRRGAYLHDIDPNTQAKFMQYGIDPVSITFLHNRKRIQVSWTVKFNEPCSWSSNLQPKACATLLSRKKVLAS